MGCGKSKLANVASGNTLLQRKKSSVNSKENETQNVDKSNGVNVENVSLESEQKSNGNENVKEIGVEGKSNESNVVEVKAPDDKALEKSHEAEAEEIKTLEIVAEKPKEELESGKDESSEKNEPEEKDIVAENKQPTEEKEDQNEKGV